MVKMDSMETEEMRETESRERETGGGEAGVWVVIEGPVQSCLLTHFQKDRTQDQDRTDHQS